MAFTTVTGATDFTSAMSPSQKPNVSTFLTLSPTQSSSLRETSLSLEPKSTETAIQAAAQAASSKPTAALSSPPIDETVTPKARRSSSVSTTSSEGIEKKRFLRLGHVHAGGDQAESDFVEED